MEDKFQQLYDYMGSAGFLQEGMTPEAFRAAYVSGDKDINRLYKALSINESLPFETGDINQFSQDFFGVVKKKEETQPIDTEPAGQESPSAYPSIRPSGAASSRSAQMGEQESGDSDFTLDPTFSTLLGQPGFNLERESRFLKGTVGDVVGSIPILGDFLDDQARAIATGYSNVRTMDEARFMLNNPSEESVQTYYDAMIAHNERVKEYGESEEMKTFLKSANKYIQEDGKWWGGFKALAENPSVAFEFMLQSGVNLLDEEALKSGLKVITTGTAGGAVAGSALPGIGNVAGAAQGFRMSLPFAMAAAGKEVEVLMSSVEFLNEELQSAGMEFTPENILSVLTDDEKYKSIRNRAVARGNTIMAVDATLGSVASNTLRVMRQAERIGDVAVVGAQVGTDVVGGGGGEMAARAMAGQEQKALDITLEAAVGPIAQSPTNLASTYMGIRMDKMRNNQVSSVGPVKYIVNGGEIDADGLSDFLETSTNDEILAANIRVENDPRMDGYVQGKVERAQIERSLPDKATPEQRAQLIELETRLNRLKDEGTRSAERERKNTQDEIDAIIDGIQRKPEEVEVTPVVDIDQESIKSNVSTRASEVSALPLESEDGATFNLDGSNYEGGGLVVPVDSKNMKASELTPEAIAEFAEQNKDKMGDDSIVKLGIYKFPGQDQVSIDLNIVVPGENRETALEFGRLAGQESLFDLDTFENVKTGATGDNPRSFTPSEFQQIAKDLKEGKVPDFMLEEGKPMSEEAVVSQAEMDAAAISEADMRAEADAKLSADRKAALDLRRRAVKEGVYLPKNYTLSGAKTFFADVLKGRTKFQRVWTKARGLMPESMFRAAENQEARVSSGMNVVMKHAKAFGRIEANIPKNEREQFYTEFDNYLRGGESGSLSPEAINLANAMRANIDNLTMRLVNEGAVNPSQIDGVLSNLGEYMTRSYKLYETKGWREQLATDEGQAIVNRAKNFLRTKDRQLFEDAQRDYTDPTKNPKELSFEEFLEERIDGKINSILDESGQAFGANPKLSSKDLDILKQRQDVPIEIRALLGEFSDPIQNYAQTILKQTQLAEANVMLNSVRDAGLGVYLFDKATGPFSVQIASEGSVTKSPLNGLWTTPEIAKAFNEAGSTQGIKGPAMSVIDLVFKGWLGTTGTVKWAKTIGSVGTHMKNVFGNLGFMAANGHTDLSMVNETLQTIRNDFGSMSNEQLNQKMERYIALGIVKQNVGLGEVREMLGEGNFEELTASRLDNSSKKWFNDKKKRAEDLYQAEDDFFKIVAYENEVNRYSKALFGVDPTKLTEQQRVELDTKVAEIVKNTYPTYSRVPEIVKLLKVNPVLGNFVSFQAESYRTMWNIVNLAKEELASDNPSVKAIGAKRMAGVASYQGAKTAIIGGMSSAAGMGLSGALGSALSSEDEQQRDKDVRKFLPPWAVDASIIPTNMDGGKFSYINASASDPFGGIDKVVNAAASGEDPAESFAKGLNAFIEPFVGTDIATRRIMNVINNQDDYGRQVYNPEAPFTDQSSDILAYVYKVFEPGTLTSIRKIYGSEGKLNEAIGQATGFKEFDVDVAEQFGFKAKEYGERMSNARMMRYENWQGTSNFDPESVASANKSLMQVEMELNELVQSAIRLGVDPEIIKSKLVDFAKVSKDRADLIMAGEFEALSDERQ